MKTYTVYFEVFGKKMKTTVQAESEHKAKEQVRNRINFHKVVEVSYDDVVNDLYNMFGMKR